MAKKKLTDYVSKKNATKDVINAGAVLGGILGARFIDRQLDKVINPVVQGISGFTGIQMSPDTAKYVKPAVITGGGIITHQIGRGKKSSIAEKFGLGMAATGIADFTSNFTNKPVLGATGEGFNDVDSEEEIQIIDAETGQPIIPGNVEDTLDLPELSGSEMLEDEYELQGDYSDDEYYLQGTEEYQLQ